MQTRHLFLPPLLWTLAALHATAAGPNTLTPAEKSAGWILLIEGKSLAGWKASEKPGTFSVRDGELVVKGPRSHLYYMGAAQPPGGFGNFEFTAEIKTWPKANSGVYFHTAWQEEGWPAQGHEVQVNNSHQDPQRTAGLYNIRKNLEAVAQDGAWFTLRIKVEGKRVITSVDGKVVIDYTEPDDWTPPDEMKGRRIARGTFALQGHDPISEVHYRNIKLRPLPTGESP